MIAISGPGAPRPLTDEGNSTTTCWPVVPKEHDLTLIEDTAEGVSLIPEPTPDMFSPLLLHGINLDLP